MANLYPIQYLEQRSQTVRNIPILSSIDCGFRNPNDQDQYGYIDIQSSGVIKQIQIRFRGDITIYEGGVNKDFKYYINYKTNFIVLSNMTKLDLGDINLIKYKGYITSIVRFRAFGYNNSNKTIVVKPSKSGIENMEGEWDSDETLLGDNNHNEYPTSPDSERILRSQESGMPRKHKSKYKLLNNDYLKLDYVRDRTKNIYTNYKKLLPGNYRLSERSLNVCGNCVHIKNRFCKLYKSPVNYKYVCNKWDNNKGIQKEFEVLKTMNIKE